MGDTGRNAPSEPIRAGGINGAMLNYSAASPSASPAGSGHLRVLLVEDHPITRQGLRAVLGGQPNLSVCGEAETAEQGLALGRSLAPDVALVDLTLRSGNGLDLTRELRAQAPQVAVLVLSMYPDTGYAERALRAGARGYLSKSDAADQLVTALRRVAGGGFFISEGELDRLAKGRKFKRKADPSLPMDTLSPRESEVFALLGEGYSTAQIAHKLALSSKTVDTHREHLKEKLGLRSGAALIRYAIEWGNLSGVS